MLKNSCVPFASTGTGFPSTAFFSTTHWIFQVDHLWKMPSRSCTDWDMGYSSDLTFFCCVAEGALFLLVYVNQHQCHTWPSMPESLSCETQGTALWPLLVYHIHHCPGDTIFSSWLRWDPWSASASELSTSWFRRSFGSSSSSRLPSQPHPSSSCTPAQHLFTWHSHILCPFWNITGRCLQHKQWKASKLVCCHATSAHTASYLSW